MQKAERKEIGKGRLEDRDLIVEAMIVCQGGHHELESTLS